IILAVGFGRFAPARGKGAIDAVQHPFLTTVADGGLLETGAGGGGDEDTLVGVEDWAEFFLNAGIKVGSFRHTMANHPLRLRIEDFGPDFSGSGNKQLDVLV